MPIYEYQCAKCHHHLEALQKISDKPLRECPECGKHTLKRLLSAPLFRLAGSGWYETDFKSDKETKRNLAGREESSSTAAEGPASGTSARPEATPAKADTTPPVSKPATATGDASKRGASAKKASKPAAARKAARTR